jgi:glyoxylase-like metal-dependent hydrolase (beta-lactamase superfamily II)
MKIRYAVIILAGIILSAFIDVKQSPLQACWNQQGKSLQGKYLQLSFIETLNELEHSFEPWQQTKFSGKGKVWSGEKSFLKSDTTISNRRAYMSKTEYSKETMLLLDYGDKELNAVTPKMHEEFIFQSARYSPVLLLGYFMEKAPVQSKESNATHAVHRLVIRGTTVKVFIRKSDNLLDKVTLLAHDPMFGDVLTTFTYLQYAKSGTVNYPQVISIDKMGGKIHDEVKIVSATLVDKADDLVTAPEGYKLKDEVAAIPETVTTVKHSDHIYFVEFAQANAQSIIVEFNDFLVVAEAPLSSENGELLIAEARKIAPKKPIRYFLFGHYHPHYLGGVRPFVHKGATILMTEPDTAYLQYLVNAPHTLQPDSLQLQPKPAKTEFIKDKKIISDGTFIMEIYFLGERSGHTKDYLFYYFPMEKLLFQDDLAWIPATDGLTKASKRQEGLYTFIVDQKLEVDTIVQGWPMKDFNVKSKFSFAELEGSVKMK